MTPENLYAALQTQAGSDFNFAEVFNGWVIQAGHPIISVRVSSDRKFVEIRQNRFLRNDTIHHDRTQWVVPLNWASNRQNSDFAYSKPMAILRNSSMKIELDEPIDWIVFNVQQAGKMDALFSFSLLIFYTFDNKIYPFNVIGFYRVNYDDETWSAIARILQQSPSSVHVFNRAQVSFIHDTYQLRVASFGIRNNLSSTFHSLQSSSMTHFNWHVTRIPIMKLQSTLLLICKMKLNMHRGVSHSNISNGFCHDSSQMSCTYLRLYYLKSN